jgi:hypothetical protein
MKHGNRNGKTKLYGDISIYTQKKRKKKKLFIRELSVYIRK